jgi:hypothetical protein
MKNNGGLNGKGYDNNKKAGRVPDRQRSRLLKFFRKNANLQTILLLIQTAHTGTAGPGSASATRIKSGITGGYVRRKYGKLLFHLFRTAFRTNNLFFSRQGMMKVFIEIRTASAAAKFKNRHLKSPHCW